MFLEGQDPVTPDFLDLHILTHWHRATKFCMEVKPDWREIFRGSTTPSALAGILCDKNADARSVCSR